MGLLRRCSIESKVFELAMDSSSTSLRICENCRGFIWSIFVQRNDSCCLEDTVELMTEKSCSIF